ncbi:MAG: hypothetical protein AAGF90_16210 [Pseudomonadota bacterium]
MEWLRDAELGAPDQFDTTWSDAAKAAVEKAVERHGGWAAWLANPVLKVETRSFTGGLASIKGCGKTFALPLSIVAPRKNQITFPEFPEKGRRAFYRSGRIKIADKATGAIVEQIDDHRSSFIGLQKQRRWNNTDIMYFIGNGLPLYLGVPFALSASQLVDHRIVRRGGAPVSRLTVDWPSDLETHSRRQSFEFASDGLFLRMEYTAEIVGSFPRAVHVATKWREVAGLLLGTRRVARPLAFGRPFGPRLAELDLKIEDAARA